MLKVWEAVKRLLYRLVPVLAYTDRLEDENAALRAQVGELQKYVMEMTRRAYFPEGQTVTSAQPASIEPDDLRTYVEQRERQSLEASLPRFGFQDLEAYERFVRGEADVNAAAKQGTA